MSDLIAVLQGVLLVALIVGMTLALIAAPFVLMLLPQLFSRKDRIDS